MKKTLRTEIPIHSIMSMGLKYREDKTLEKFPLFKIYRFEIREIDVIENPFQEKVNAFLITSNLVDEKIILCLIENRKGEIVEIKSCRKIETDKELSFYITKSFVEWLSEQYYFRLKKN
jgi:hypothetical protein